MKFRICSSVASPLWKRNTIPSKALLCSISNTTLREAFPTMADCYKFEISILFGDNQMITIHNNTYLKKNKPTNVLSFPSLEIHSKPETLIQHIHSSAQYCALGDIIMAYETILQESLEQDKAFNNHVIHLFVHSVLHLLGFDHQKRNDRKVMEYLEIKIMHKLGIENPFL